jgi:hypothetical protein
VKFNIPSGSGVAGTVAVILGQKDTNNAPTNIILTSAPIAYACTGALQQVDVPITMPAGNQGTAQVVFANIYLGSTLWYQYYDALNTVIIPGAGGGGAITWD